MKRTLFRSLLVTSLLGAALSSSARAAKPEIWFCPLDSVARTGADFVPTVQFMDLFRPDSPWQQAASHVSVFKIYQDWAREAPDFEMKAAFADLKRRGIPLALEVDVITPRTPADLGHGVFGRMSLLKFARRIIENGGDLKYIAMDEPLSLTVKQGSSPAVMGLQEVVDNVVKNIREMQAVYPNVKIGDIEDVGMVPLQEEVDQYREGWKAFKRAGIPLVFFHGDQDWFRPGIEAYLKAHRDAAHEEGMEYGVIVDGDFQDRSDADWLDHAEKRVMLMDAALGKPDTVIFQTWMPCPKKLLPEQDADAFTHMINLYTRTRSGMTVAADGNTVSGKLLTIEGRPIADATIQVSAEPDKSGVMSTLTGTGVVPDGCQNFCFGIWAAESGWPGEGPLRVNELKLETKDGWSFSRTSPGGNPVDWVNQAPRATKEGGTFNVLPHAGDLLIYNSPHFPLTGKAGQTFTFTIQAQVPPAAKGAGCFGVFFFGPGDELWRTLVQFRAAETPLGTAVTGKDGSWSFQLPSGQSGVKIKAAFDGDGKYWPASFTH